MSDEGKRVDDWRLGRITVGQGRCVEDGKERTIAVVYDGSASRIIEEHNALRSIPDPAALVEAARRVERAERLWTETPIAIRDCSAGLLRLDELRDAIIALRTALNPEEPHDGD